MHVNAKKTAVSGLLMALSVVLIVLSGILDFSTLFFLAAAAFFVGIIIKEYGLGYGTAFFAGLHRSGLFAGSPEVICADLCYDESLCIWHRDALEYGWENIRTGITEK